jgi:glycosyltransferase involved in cell wall biosynthesis
LAKRILIYTNHFYPEQFKINEIVEWLSLEDYEIRVVTGIPNYPSGRFHNGFGFKSIFRTNYRDNVIVNRLPLIPRGSGNYFMLSLNFISYFLSALIFTIYLLFKKRYDFIFVHHTSPFLIAIHPILYSFFYKKTKNYLWDLDIWPESLQAIGILKSSFLETIILKSINYIYSYYDKIMISSNELKNIIKERYDGEIIYFPNWAEECIEKNIYYEDLNIDLPIDKFMVMYTGNIGEAQNFNDLINTIKELKNEKLLWIFLGGGRYKKEFQSNLKKNNLSKLCIFKNQVRVDEVPSYAKYANFMFLSLKKNSVFEKTIPAKLQTYLALKKPVIGVLQGAGAKIIKHSKCGIVEEDGDYINLAHKIRKLLKLSNEEIKLMGENGRKFYENNFSQAIRKDQLLNLFR